MDARYKDTAALLIFAAAAWAGRLFPIIAERGIINTQFFVTSGEWESDSMIAILATVAIVSRFSPEKRFWIAVPIVGLLGIAIALVQTFIAIGHAPDPTRMMLLVGDWICAALVGGAVAGSVSYLWNARRI